MVKGFVCFLAVFLFISCKNRNFTADEILTDLSKKYFTKEAIAYKAAFRQKFFDSDDTISINALCKIYRVPNDTLFGGFISYSTSQGDTRIYDLKNIYVVDSSQNKVTIYKAHEGQEFAINGNFSASVLNNYFLHPERLINLVNNPLIEKSSVIDNLKGVPCYRINFKFPDEDGFTEIKRTIWVKNDFSEILGMKSSVKYEGVYEYKECYFDKTEYDDFDTSIFEHEKKQSQEKYKTDFYEEKDLSFYKLLPLGAEAPAFNAINAITGEKVFLKDLKGKLVILDFFFMSCSPCVKAIPELIKLQDKYHKDDLVILALDSNDNIKGEIEKLPAFIAKHKINYEVLLVDNKVSNDFNVRVYPSLYLIDKQGNIVFTQLGYNENLLNELSLNIEKILDN